MIFYYENELGKYQGGSTAESSGDADNAFSDTANVPYTSSGETASTTYVERKLEFEATIDSIFVLNQNLDDLTIYAAATSGGSYVDITANATLQMSQDGLHRYYKFATPFSFYDIKFECADTSPSGQEKRIGAILGLLEIGTIERFSAINTVKNFIRKTASLDSGGTVTMNKGSYWSFKLNTQYVGVQSEVDVAYDVQNATQDIFFWLNGGYDGEEKVKVEPYRFKDLLKCVVTGKSKPNFYKNFLNNVVNDEVTFEQTGMVD